MSNLFLKLFGIQRTDFTEGGRWHVEWAGVPERGDGIFLMLLAIGIALGAIVWLYRRDTRRLKPGARVLLTGLRLAAFAVVLIMLLEPVVVFSKDEDVQQNLVVLVDTSPSMGLTDAWRESEGASDVARALGFDSLEALRSANRIDLAQRVLDSGLLDELTDGGRIEVQVLSFADGLHAKPLGDDAEPGAPGVQEGQEAPDSGTTAPRLAVDSSDQVTAIGPTLRALLQRLRQQPLAGVLMLTDGQANQGETVQEVLRGADALRAPISSVAIGTPTGPRNAEVVALEIDPVVFVRDENDMVARLRARGMQDEIVRLLLEGRRNGGPWEPIEERTVTLAADGAEVQTTFRFSEESQVELDFRVSLLPLTGEPAEPDPSAQDVDQNDDQSIEESPRTIVDANRDDNIGVANTQVIRPELRVLLVAGSTFPEVQFIRNALLRDQGVELSVWLQSADPDYRQPGDYPIKRLPRTIDELNRWDCVVLYDPDPDDWPDTFPGLLTEFVAERGGGLVYIAGEFFTQEVFDRYNADRNAHRWVGMLPVVREPGLFLSSVQVELTKENPWYLQITPEGERSSIFAFGNDSGTGRPLVQVLPGMYWHYVVTREKPGATVLARHGDARMEGRDGKRHVLMATQLVGPGRSFFIAFDSTYRWRYANEDLFDGFWARLVDAAGRNKQLGGAYPFRLETDQDTYAPGDRVTVTATFNDPTLAPALARLEGTLERGDDAAEPFALVATDEPHVFVGTFSADRTGPHAVRVAAGGSADLRTLARPNTARFNVERPGLEFETPTLNAQTLQDAARLTGGRVFSPAQIDTIAASFSAERPIRTLRNREEAWDAPIFAFILLATLIAEWILRKRFRLI